MQQRIPYDGNDLGAVYTKKYTAFRLWAPTADAVTLCLYREGDGDCLSDTLPMKRDVQGTWTIRVDGDLRHVYYTYRLERSGKTVESQDPYSVAVGVNGQRSMVLDLKETDPENFKEDHGPVFSNRTDLVICEISVLDSTADGSSGVKYPGKYLGLAEKGTKNKEGEATGLDYLKSLGITHVQIMPMYDFASIDEAAPKKREYNWGYDPLNYNVPEGSFSTDPFHGEVRIREMKEMIAASTVLSCLSLDDHSKREYVMNLCKEKQVQFDRDAFRWFLTRVGNDPLRIENEIEKCSIYASHITLEDVEALVAPEPMDNVFKMVDALFNRNALLLLSYYRNFRALNMEPLAIVGLLASQIRFLFQVRVCMEQGLSKNEIAQELHAHPYRVQVNQERAYDFDLDQLLDQLVQLATFDQEMKMGMVDKDEGFEQFVLRLLIEN